MDFDWWNITLATLEETLGHSPSPIPSVATLTLMGAQWTNVNLMTISHSVHYVCYDRDSDVL